MTDTPLGAAEPLRVAQPLRVVGEVPLPDGLLDAFLAYDRALLTNDVESLDRLFDRSAHTLRAAGGRVLAGWDAIAGFRAGRAGTPTRVVTGLHVRRAGEAVLLQAETTDPAGRGHGVQTQLWGRVDGAWRVLAAHVTAPQPGSAPFDRRIWRCVGDPLVRGAADGPLSGVGVAVKDLFAVRGFPIGAGVPAWLAEAAEEPRHAAAVSALLDAGADVVGIARTDQFAFSLAGQNAAYGTPPNPIRPDRIPGGSTSGPTTAVALGQADLALGTDTAGSTRIPASYQALWGIRTSHGLVDRTGLVPLAGSFDTVGLLAREPGLVVRALETLVPPASRRALTVRRVLVVDELDALAEDWLADRALRAAERLATAVGGETTHLTIASDRIERWFRAFRTVQAAEAWQGHGRWISDHPGSLGEDVEGRFRAGAALTEDEVAAARDAVAEEGAEIRALVEDALIVVPTVPSLPPALDADPTEIERHRGATLRLNCLAGLGGLPSVSAPVVDRRAVVVGAEEPGNVCVLARPGSDVALAALCGEVLGRTSGRPVDVAEAAP